jgi:ADP-ribosylglycohydrolase
MQKDRTLSIIGCLLGTAVGDALGLPYEGLAKRKIKLPIDRHRFLFGRGMVSDDTEHTCMVAQSLIVSAGDERIFAKALAWRLRFWLLLLPAGIG